MTTTASPQVSPDEESQSRPSSGFRPIDGLSPAKHLLHYLPPVFAKFVATESSRYAIDEPWIVGEEVFATNGRVAVRARLDELDPHHSIPGELLDAVRSHMVSERHYPPMGDLAWAPSMYRERPLPASSLTVHELSPEKFFGEEDEDAYHSEMTPNRMPVWWPEPGVALASWIVAPLLANGFVLRPRMDHPIARGVLAVSGCIRILAMPYSVLTHNGLVLRVQEFGFTTLTELGSVELARIDELQYAADTERRASEKGAGDA